MNDNKTILVINGASASDLAPNFLSVVTLSREGKYECVAEKKSVERGGPERFPIYLQAFIQQGFIKPETIDLIAVIIGPGSFTGLRASIAFALGMQTGLACPVIALRRGEVLFPVLEKHYPSHLIWHVTSARRHRVFIESNQETKVKAYDINEIPWPTMQFVLAGEAVPTLVPLLAMVKSWQIAEIQDADAIMIAKTAVAYQQADKITNTLYPLYIDPPKASLPAKGLRQAPH